MSRLLIRLVINAVALYVSANLISGIHFAEGDTASLGSLLVIAVIFGVVNALIKPIVKAATCPAYILTLGLFTFIVNGFMLEITDWLAGNRFQVDSFSAAILGGLIISIVSTVLSIFVVEEDK
jgi:putative membrane protein